MAVLLSVLLSVVTNISYMNVPVSIGNHSTPEMDFAIDLLPSDQQPPEILDPVLEVLLGGTVALGKDLSLAFTCQFCNCTTLNSLVFADEYEKFYVAQWWLSG